MIAMKLKNNNQAIQKLVKTLYFHSYYFQHTTSL